jgi:hypothetical protein
MTLLIDIVLVTISVIGGFMLGYRYSHEVYGKMDDGLLLFKWVNKEEKTSGWDGMPAAFDDIRKFLIWRQK